LASVVRHRVLPLQPASVRFTGRGAIDTLFPLDEKTNNTQHR
jgi:hypothetical protein